MSRDGLAKAREIAAWKQVVQRGWPVGRVESVAEGRSGARRVGEGFTLAATVRLGEVSPGDVAVEAYHGPLDATREVRRGQAVLLSLERSLGGGRRRYSGTIPCDRSRDAGLRRAREALAPGGLRPARHRARDVVAGLRAAGHRDLLQGRRVNRPLGWWFSRPLVWRRSLALTPVLAAAALHLLSLAAPATPVEGRVVLKDRGLPVADAEVSVLGRPGHVLTDAEGRFVLVPHTPAALRRARGACPAAATPGPIRVEALPPGALSLEVEWAVDESLTVTAETRSRSRGPSGERPDPRLRPRTSPAAPPRTWPRRSRTWPGRRRCPRGRRRFPRCAASPPAGL